MSKNDFKSGLMFSAFGKYSNLVIQLIVNSVLARLLTPEDYGVIAVVQIFVVFFDQLAEMGFGPAVIQNKTLDKDDIRVIFRFSIIVAVFLGLFFGVLGYPVNIFYNEDVFVPIFLILGLEVFFHGILVVPRSLLLKQKNFKTVNLVEVIAGAISGIVSIGLALLQFNYYALILGRIVKILLVFGFYYTHTQVSPRVKLRREPIAKIWAFARNQFTFNFINYFSRNLDNILIGRYMSPTQLAYYNRSYQISLYPNQLLTGIVTPVIQPIMSDYEDKLHVIKDVYLKMVRLLANIGIPLSVFCFFAAEDIILFLFGDQWIESIPVFQILAISIWEQMIASSTGAFYQSSNRTDLLLFSGVQSMILNILAIIYGVYLGSVESVAIMIVISFMINFLINNYLLLYKIFDASFIDALKAISKPCIIGFIHLGIFVFLPQLTDNSFINLSIKGTLFIVGLVIGLLVTKQYQELKKMIFN